MRQPIDDAIHRGFGRRRRGRREHCLKPLGAVKLVGPIGGFNEAIRYNKKRSPRAISRSTEV